MFIRTADSLSPRRYLPPPPASNWWSVVSILRQTLPGDGGFESVSLQRGDAMGRAARMAISSLYINRWSAAMPQPNDLSRSLVPLDQDSTLIAVVEMSQSSWLGGVILL